MRCEQIKELLSPFMDHMTDEKENKLINAHLKQCPACRQELEELRLMCSFLGELQAPQIPAKFSEDLHLRLMEEKTGIFTNANLKKPQRSGWIAAGVAGLAISLGIYVSSVLPIGALIATWQGEPKGQPEKPKLAVEEILRSIKGWNFDKNEVTPEVDMANNEANVSPTPMIADNNNPESNSTEIETNSVSKPLIDSTPKFVDEYLTKIKVTDLAAATDQVMQLAEANGAEYTLTNGSTMQVLSAANAKEVRVQIDKSKSTKLLKQLGALGDISPLMHNQIELTEEYVDLEEQIITTEKVIKDLEAKNKLSELNNKQLEELKTHLASCQEKQEQLKQQENTVILKVVIEEDVNP